MKAENRLLTIFLVFLASGLVIALVQFSGQGDSSLLSAQVVDRVGACYDDGFCANVTRSECYTQEFSSCFWRPRACLPSEADINNPVEGEPGDGLDDYPYAEDLNSDYREFSYVESGFSDVSAVEALRECRQKILDRTIRWEDDDSDTGLQLNFPCSENEERVVVIDTRQCEGPGSVTTSMVQATPYPYFEYEVTCGKVILCIAGGENAPNNTPDSGTDDGTGDVDDAVDDTIDDEFDVPFGDPIDDNPFKFDDEDDKRSFFKHLFR